MTKVPTAEEQFKMYSNLYQFEEGPSEYLIDKEDFVTAVIEFARLHRKAMIEAVNENGKLDVEDVVYGIIEVQDGYCGHEGYNDDLILVSINKESIDNAYPESLIQ